MKTTIVIYCDGSSIGNPGPGGWGVVISSGMKVKELGGYEKETTNNRMELTAAIESLNALRTRAKVTVHTDSQYVINGITKWVFGWEKNGWQTKEKEDVLNKDLWQALVLATEKHEVTWEHVRGHEGIELNERVDMIAHGYARQEHVRLFIGTEEQYKEFRKDMPKARIVSSSRAKRGKAYSYVSCVDGNVMTHKTWEACEKRVKGKRAQYKKVFTHAEEQELVAQWSR